MPSLNVELFGLELKNPTILASGILDTTGASMKRVVVKGGAGAVVTKSISKAPMEGHKNPSVIALENGLLNAIGLANPGYEGFRSEIEVAKTAGAPVIGSVFGTSPDEFAEVAGALAEYGADAIEINLSCPNVEGAKYAHSPELSREAVAAVKAKVKKPIIAKLSAEVPNIVEIAGACVDAGCDGVTAINTVKAMKIDVEAKMPVLANKTGGLSGTSIKPIAVRCVYEIAKELDVPVIGCGGITTGEDAVEFLMAGAKAVQIGSAVYSRGLWVFRKVVEEMEVFMEREGYGSVDELIGAAL
ncbi:MAG: dihydroorotate dehydrogenase [Candidatus Hydrothermarchaeales archaeon]